MKTSQSLLATSFLAVGLVFLSGCGQTMKDEGRNVVINLPTSTAPVVTIVEEKPDTMMGDDHMMGATSTTSTAPMAENVDTKADGKEDHVFKMGGKNFAFTMDGKENPDLKVKVGDKVRIEFTSDAGFHDWVVDEFKAATKQVQTGGTTSVEFVVDKKGTFEYYCSVGKHRQNGMVGKLIVE